MAIIIYFAPGCPFCHMAKDYLSEKGVEFKERDVSSDKASLNEMVEKSKQLGVPVLDIDGKIIIGFNREAIDREISNNNKGGNQ